jgi:hypothetical protein
VDVRVLSLFEVTFVALFEADFPFRFPHAVQRTGSGSGNGGGARGDHKQAAHYYRQVIDFVRAHPDQYEPAFETTFQRLVQKLDPPATA